MAKGAGGRAAIRTIRVTDEIEVRPFLTHAIAATLGVVVLPLSIVLSVVYSLETPPGPALLAFGSIALVVAASAIGAFLWQRVPESEAIEFGELMLWAWARRDKAEREVKLHSVELGLDPRGLTTTKLPRARRLELLRSLTTALEEKDSYTRGHSKRVERLTYNTAVALGLRPRDVQLARTAAAVHDVGKIYVPDEILRKPDRLTEVEFDTVKNHAAHGGKMVEPLGDADVTAAVRHHHERWDGRGYPEGLVAHEIPVVARIIAVADTYDAMTSTRTYRSKRSRREALAILEAESGKQLDPEIVPVFLAGMRQRAGYYFSSLLLIPYEALARLASWGKKRTEGLTAAALALVVALAAGAFGPQEMAPPSSPVVAAPEARVEAAPEQPAARADRPERSPGQPAESQEVATAPVEEDVVLGTRFTAEPEPEHKDPRSEPRALERPAVPVVPPIVVPTPSPDPPIEPPEEPGEQPTPEPSPSEAAISWPPGRTEDDEWPPRNGTDRADWPPGHRKGK